MDAALSEAAKVEGMKRAMEHKKSLVKHVREWMKDLGRRQRFVTADDVQAMIVRNGISVRAMGNSMGGIFQTKDWRSTGRYVKSERVHAHRNPILVWEYIGK